MCDQRACAYNDAEHMFGLARDCAREVDAVHMHAKVLSSMTRHAIWYRQALRRLGPYPGGPYVGAAPDSDGTGNAVHRRGARAVVSSVTHRRWSLPSATRTNNRQLLAGQRSSLDALLRPCSVRSRHRTCAVRHRSGLMYANDCVSPISARALLWSRRVRPLHHMHQPTPAAASDSTTCCSNTSSPDLDRSRNS
jgi:hypothetical protein